MCVCSAVSTLQQRTGDDDVNIPYSVFHFDSRTHPVYLAFHLLALTFSLTLDFRLFGRDCWQIVDSNIRDKMKRERKGKTRNKIKLNCGLGVKCKHSIEEIPVSSRAHDFRQKRRDEQEEEEEEEKPD